MKIEALERGMARAAATRTRVYREPEGYRVRSAETGGWHHVRVQDDAVVCDCKGYAYRGACRHIGGVIRRMQREGFLTKPKAIAAPVAPVRDAFWAVR